MELFPEPHVGEHKVVSLFSGCGGMDLGFLGGFAFGGKFYDDLPFEIVWANDIDRLACDTYAANFGANTLHRGDVDDVIDTLPDSVDVVIGGFPCQDVSINGQRSVENGERTILYKRMIEVVKRCNPDVFVAENVKGLLMSHGKPFFDQMLADFNLDGYTVSHRLYLAADYGVPQMRERIFIIGVKGDNEFSHPERLDDQMTAQMALEDLESAHEDKAISHIWSKAQRSPEQGNRRLKADKPATTIRAEHHGNIQWHYKLDRRISLREAARLQSFPDHFAFVCAMRQTERQIGNAVPPVLAWHIAKAVREHLDSYSQKASVRLGTFTAPNRSSRAHWRCFALRHMA
ncbi:MAG: DNA cytosine methyltransferase [Gammaproteobacteria bacterium]|nr:DNA cytosine methyltransferase [Gammaproteobacteria bacterium]